MPSDQNADQAQGYFTDAVYVPTFSFEGDPRVIGAISRLFGQISAPTNRFFTYADFGCGVGAHLLSLASVFPHAEFVGIDLNAQQIEAAKHQAGILGLTNISFICASFSDAPNLKLAPLDFAVTFGVMSWLSSYAQNQLAEAMSRHLKPSGIAAVHYQLASGVQYDRNFRHLLKRMIDAGVSPDQAFAQLSKHSKFAPDFDPSKTGAGSNLRYLSHEYLSTHWTPHYPSGLAELMTNAGLEMVGPWRAQANLRTAFDAQEPAHFLEDLAAVQKMDGSEIGFFSKTAAQAPPKSLAQELHLWRLPLPSEGDEDPFAKKRAARKLSDVLPEGLDGDARLLQFKAFETGSAMVLDHEIIPMRCEGRFQITSAQAALQIAHSAELAWPRTGLALAGAAAFRLPFEMAIILHHCAERKEEDWPELLKNDGILPDDISAILKGWRDVWAPILAGLDVISSF